MRELDLFSAPLEGVTLIEASAGTGKTWSITGFFLRLLLEHRLDVDQILVVTFTQAATEELRVRIRKRLMETHRSLTTGRIPVKDAFLETAAERYSGDPNIVGLLENALRNFDRAAVSTLHGFCLRILQEYAFETGAPFDAELLADPKALIQEVCDDFWRIHMAPAPPEFIGYCSEHLKGPETFFSLWMHLRRPDMVLLPVFPESPFSALERFRLELNELRKAWPSSREGVLAALSEAPLNRRSYSEKRMIELMDEMDRWISADPVGYPLSARFPRFTAGFLATAVHKGKSAPEHPFFTLCQTVWETAEKLQQEMHRRLLFLKTRFFSDAEQALTVRKTRLGYRFYEDLLVTLRDALRKRGASRLTRLVAEKYRAALVDEFQDTDPVQYEIFSRLFSGPRRALFMIGDPKQAIYGFRGADVFSYMNAARKTRYRRTLVRNFRSAPGLVQAVNTLFAGVRCPFLFEEIPFHAGTAAKPENAEDVPGGAPLKIWFLRGKGESPLGKNEAVAAVSRAIGSEILALLGTGCFHESDIAVLVRTHHQARIVKQALEARAVPAVLFSEASVFDSHEMVEMERLLLGIQDPLNPFRLKAALSTDMMGYPASLLDPAFSENRKLEAVLSRFQTYHTVWESRGFIPMFAGLLEREGVKERLIRFPDGERRLTNLTHLAELLHQASAANRFTMAGLLKWLAEARDSQGPRAEAHQLRLESDADAVAVVTMHRSKGLEYPVVFCPFAWEGIPVKTEALAFHDPDVHPSLVVDLDPEANPKGIWMSQKECLAENIRLLYVALTRAKARCYLAWGRIRGAESSALTFLLHALPQTGFDDPARPPAPVLEEILAQKGSGHLADDLEALVKKANGSIAVTELPEDHGTAASPKPKPPTSLVCRTFAGKVPTEWRVSSYSALIADPKEAAEGPDRDAAGPEAAPGPSSEKDLFSFPAGSRAGLFFHSFFESLDFSAPPLSQQALAEATLAAYGIDVSWSRSVCEAAHRVLNTRLDAAHGDLILSALSPQNRVHEMEFHFPVRRICPSVLASAFSETGNNKNHEPFPQRLGRLRFSPWEGFLHGFVDLVAFRENRYYIIDWKSNLLGTAAAHYSKKRLAETMEDAYYRLQSRLYVLAVCRHLKLRIPDFSYENHFGGVFYLFIRGIFPDPESGRSATGIDYDLPDPESIARLEKTLIPTSENA